MGSPDMQKFLYTIIKQLDLKSVDWSLIAEATGITNGHAARMRYSRFKRQMEGHVVVPRKPKTETAKVKAKTKNPKEEDDKHALKIKLEKTTAAYDSATGTPSPGVSETMQSPPFGPSRPTRASAHQSPAHTPKLTLVKSEPCDDLVGPHSRSQDKRSSHPLVTIQLPLPEFQAPSSSNNHVLNFNSPHHHVAITHAEAQQGQFSAFGGDNHLGDFDMGNTMCSDGYQPGPNSRMLQGLMEFNLAPEVSTSQLQYLSGNDFGPASGQMDTIGGSGGSNSMVKREDGWINPY